MSLLEVKNLRVRFDTPAGAVHAVDDVSFALEEGETLGLVGESGSGKSITCLALLGLVPGAGVVETGEVLLAGENLLTASPARLRGLRGNRISIVFQDPQSALNPLLPIGLQLSEVLEVHRGLARREARARAAAALGDVGLPEPESMLRRYPHELSGGMRQRALIAMALLCEPQVLIADEPTTALDATLSAQVLDLLLELQHRHGTAVLLVSHDLGVMARYARRVMVMYAGRVVETAAAADLFLRPLHPYTLALMRSMPTLVHPAGQELPAIPGQPPDLATLGEGCAFAPRCSFVRERCKRERPPLAAYGGPGPAAAAQPRGSRGSGGSGGSGGPGGPGGSGGGGPGDPEGRGGHGAQGAVRLGGRRAACFEIDLVAQVEPYSPEAPADPDTPRAPVHPLRPT